MGDAGSGKLALFSVFPKQSPFSGVLNIDRMSEMNTLETFLRIPPFGQIFLRGI